MTTSVSTRRETVERVLTGAYDNEARSRLAKLIHSMSGAAQRQFRDRFPTPIQDYQVDAASSHAQHVLQGSC